MTLKAKFVVYLVLVHLPFIALAVWALAARPVLLLAVELFFALSLAAGVWLVRAVFAPLDLLRSGGQLLQESDFASRLRPIGQPETDALVGVYNGMVDHLREERIRLQEQHWFLEKVLRASPSGIVTLALDGTIAAVNPAAEAILRRPAGDLLGRRLEEVEGSFTAELASLRSGESKVLPLMGRRRLKCHRSEFLDRGFPRAFYVMEELTEELRLSEKAAYEKLIRMMSHEVNNSAAAAVSLLQSCQRYAGQIGEEDREDFVKALGVVIARTGQLDEFMRAFSDVVRIPPPRCAPTDLREMLEGIATLFGAETGRRRIGWVWTGLADGEIGGAGPTVSAKAMVASVDRGQMEQVFVNVFKNAIEAIDRDGTITVRIGERSGRPCVVVEDTGSGISPDVARNLFAPFFTSKANGQGIGLTIVQEILTQHGAEFGLEGAPGQPTRFTIQF